MSRALLISFLGLSMGCNGTVTPGDQGDSRAGDSGLGDSLSGDSDAGDSGGGDPGFALLPYEADVYRDDNGVPHIEAGSEEAAWYAIGYEEARDSLFHVQVNVKRVRGHAARLIDSGPANVLADFINQALDLYLDLEPVEMRELLRISDPPTGNPYQVYDNLVAYTLGLNDYRLDLAAGDVDTAELDARTWIEVNGYDWALTDEITIADIVSWGRWSRAGLQWGMASIMDRNPRKVTIAATRKSRKNIPPRIVWQSPAEAPEWVELQHLVGNGRVGSNSYAWSYDYMEVDGVPHTGMVGDPHQTSRQWPNPDDPMSLGDLAHVWFLHVRVPNPTHPLDAFGYIQHATGMMFLQHNNDVAVGGSAGAPNIADSFLLRLKTDVGGNIEQPLAYYSVYADTDLDDGADSEDWVPLVPREITVEVQDTHEPFTHTVLYAGPYGIVVNTTPFYADVAQRFVPGEMTYAADPGPGLSPVLVAYRLTVLDAVDGADHHDRFVVGMYELMHARNVYDIIESVNKHEFAYMVQFDAVDRWGRLFAVSCGAVPQRGDDTLLMAAGYNAFPDKYMFYHHGSDPVPARHAEDRMFNWVHEIPGDPTSGVKFLKAEGSGGEGDLDYMPYILFDPEDDVYNPPPVLDDPSDPSFGENPGFVSNSNDATFHGYRKRPTYEEQMAPSGNPFNSWASNTELINQTLEAGTAYHTGIWPATLEGHARSKHTVDHLSDIMRENITPGTGDPKMDLAGGLDFAQDNRLYVEREYHGPDGNGARPELDGLPIHVRVLYEAYLDLDAVVIPEYDQEVAFFRDLWAALYQPAPGSHWESYPLDPGGGVHVSLKDIWVGDGSGNPSFVFYYPVDNNGEPGSAALIEVPPFGQLIDFLWEGSFPGVREGDDLVAFTSTDRTRLDQLMQLLVDWDESSTPDDLRYRNRSDSRAAALLAQYHLGLLAAEYDEAVSRAWLPLYSGLIGSDADADALCPVAPGVEALTAEGRMPPVEANGAFASGSFPRVMLQGYDVFEQTGNPGSQPIGGDYASWFGTGVFQPIDGFAGDLPYDALYSDVDNRIVRTTLEPEHINALVEFLFNLGGWDLDEREGHIQSAKLAVYNLPVIADCGGGIPRGDALAGLLRPGYPLTQGMVRVLLLRRLLETDQVLQTWYGELPTFGDIFRTRTYDYDGELRYPTASSGTLEEGLPMQGGGILRSVGCMPEVGVPVERGFQRKMYCIGGSARPIFTFFPKDRPNEVPKSFFWNPPGQNTARFDSVHFADHTDAFRTNTPLPTRLRDYRDHPSPEYESPVRYELGAP